MSHAGDAHALDSFSAVTTAAKQAGSETSATRALEFFRWVRAANSG